MNRRYISIGGWCGTTIGLRGCNMYNESLPFDYVRSTMEGVIKTLESDFESFFPERIEMDTDIPGYMYNHYSIRGKYIGFFHHDIREEEVRDTFKRRWERMKEYMREEGREIYFLRTIVEEDFIKREIGWKDRFHELIQQKYGVQNYRLIYILPQQQETKFYRRLDDKTDLYLLNDLNINYLHVDQGLLIEDYRRLWKEMNNSSLEELKMNSKLYYIQDVPMVKDNEK